MTNLVTSECATTGTTCENGERLFALVPCGGSGARAGAGGAKQYRVVAGEPVLIHTLRALLAVPRLTKVLVVVAGDDTQVDAVLSHAPGLAHERVELARTAGRSRAQTVYQGLNALLAQGAQSHDWVLVHDAARCLVRAQEVESLIDACWPDAVGGLLALKLPDTLKAEVQGRVTATVTREDKWLAQTPQMFRIRDLYCALALAEADGFTRITDEASAIEALGLQPLLVTGRADNLKLTYPDDFMLADAVLRARQQQAAAVAFTDLSPAAAMPLMAQAPPPVAPSFLGLSPPPSPSPSAGMTWRMGEGWDCHALVPGRALVLGGVTVPHHLGLLGHSDADVLLHAIIDALLGAAGLGDIGRHFPDTDARFRGADSAMLLTETMQRVQAGGWRLVNLDCTVVAQAPKLAPHIPAMQARIAQTLGVAITQVNVKAKTAEKLGPVGQGLSMEARAVVMLSSS